MGQRRKRELTPGLIAFIGRQALYETGIGREWPQNHDGQLADWLEMGNDPSKKSIEYFNRARRLRRVMEVELDRQKADQGEGVSHG